LSASDKARVLIVEDHPIFRDGLVQLINRQRDLIVCAEAADAKQALAAAESELPDVVLLDLMLQGTGGLELLKQLRAFLPKVPVLVLTMNDETLYAERALRAGASGYLMKQEASSTVITAIRAVLAGEIHVSRAIEVTLMRKGLAAADPTPSQGAGRLSDRELQVFELIGAGVPTREIATRLGISVKTIETHRENIKRKLELASGAELVGRAQRWVRGSPDSE
jgi:DNA-binding NarL/FixJ family response regulator